MSGIRTWVLVVILTALVIGLIVAARGPDHHRGDEVGARQSPVILTHSAS
jgi:hypothetical protein